VEILDMPRQAPELPGDRRQQRIAKARIVVEGPPEPIATKDQGRARLDCDDGGRPIGTVEQGQLTEEVAWLEDSYDRLLSTDRGQHNLEATLGDDMQRVSRVAGVKDDLTAPKPADLRLDGEAPHRIGFGSAEEGAPGECR